MDYGVLLLALAVVMEATVVRMLRTP